MSSTFSARCSWGSELARPEFKFDQRASDIRLAQPRAWFWGTLVKFWPIYSQLLLASALINCFALASPLFIMNVYDRVVPNNAIETLWVLALGVATVFAFEFVIRNLRTYFVDVAGAAAAEGRIQRSWERFVGLTAESSGKARFISGIATTFAQVSIQMSTVAVVVYGVHLIGDGDITMGALIAATILTGRALAPLSSIAAMLTRLQQSRVALRSLDAIMKAPVERPAGKTFLHRPKLDGEIEFKQVSFDYPGQESHALEDISFKVKPGERIGVLGRIGSGKSTIARLLIGLYEPADGAVLMDGTDIRQIDPADLRRNVGYVSQDNYLFFGTVRDNIAFGAPHLDDPAILRAAHVAGVSDFLRSHPHGFDLQVGERGMALSGGQRQAIVIARALLLDPKIILLDEPTSNMDNSTEAMFKKRLGEILPDKTLLLVTHRSSLLSLVDRLLIVDGGKIVADGPKEDVLNALKQGQIRAASG